MKEFEIINVTDGVNIVYVPTDKFKTNEITVSFLAPLSEETAAANALLFSLLSSTTAEYPTLEALNKKLAMLYGAKITGAVSKSGENQNLSLVATCLADRFAIDGESISAECFELLMKMLFKPSLDENGEFKSADLKREKKLLCDKLDAEFNEKRTYSLRRLEELMFAGEPFAVNKYGTKDEINALESAELVNALASVLKHSKVQITIVGSVDIDSITDTAKSCFVTVDREYIPPVKAVFKPFADEVKTFSERIDVEQGKLVIGFRVNREDNFEGCPEIRLFSDIFGGGPYSKLFNNVREKLSLCYYCIARFDRRKSNVIIQCGCEEENMDKALNEIQNQLADIANGDFAAEYDAAKMGMNDFILSVLDDSVSLNMWYAGQIADNSIITPEQSAEENNAVTAEEISESARLLTLDTVFKLLPTKEEA